MALACATALDVSLAFAWFGDVVLFCPHHRTQLCFNCVEKQPCSQIPIQGCCGMWIGITDRDWK